MGAAASRIYEPRKIFTNDRLKPLDASDIKGLSEARQELERYAYSLPGFSDKLLEACRKQVQVARVLEVENNAQQQELVDVSKVLARQVM